MLRSIVRELKEMRDGIGSTSKRGAESKLQLSRTKSHIAPDVLATTFEFIQQGQWANLPQELLFDIIQRVEESETSWPARAVVVFCASVCKSWRSITKEIVKTPEQCGRITFPISLKQVINSSPLSALLYYVSYVLFLLCVWIAWSTWFSNTVLYQEEQRKFYISVVLWSGSM